MTDVVNLNRLRKKKRAEAAEAQAAENRAKFGRTKAEKARDKQERARVDRLAHGRELDPGTSED